MTTQEPNGGERDERHVERTETIDEGRIVRPEELPDPAESDVRDEENSTDTEAEDAEEDAGDGESALRRNLTPDEERQE